MTANTGHHAAEGDPSLLHSQLLRAAEARLLLLQEGATSSLEVNTCQYNTEVILRGQSLALLPGPQRLAGGPPNTILSLNRQVT